MRLSRPGTLIVADNVVQGGAVVDAEGGRANAEVIRRFNRALAEHPRLDSIIVPLVRHSIDGIALALVRERTEARHGSPFRPAGRWPDRTIADPRGRGMLDGGRAGGTAFIPSQRARRASGEASPDAGGPVGPLPVGLHPDERVPAVLIDRRGGQRERAPRLAVLSAECAVLS